MGELWLPMCEQCKEHEAYEQCELCDGWFCIGCAYYHSEACGLREENDQ